MLCVLSTPISSSYFSFIYHPLVAIPFCSAWQVMERCTIVWAGCGFEMAIMLGRRPCAASPSLWYSFCRWGWHSIDSVRSRGSSWHCYSSLVFLWVRCSPSTQAGGGRDIPRQRRAAVYVYASARFQISYFQSCVSLFYVKTERRVWYQLRALVSAPPPLLQTAQQCFGMRLHDSLGSFFSLFLYSTC